MTRPSIPIHRRPSVMALIYYLINRFKKKSSQTWFCWFFFSAIHLCLTSRHFWSVFLQHAVELSQHTCTWRGEQMFLICQFFIEVSVIVWVSLRRMLFDFAMLNRNKKHWLSFPACTVHGLFVCVSAIQLHLLLYLLWTNITVTDVQAGPFPIDCYCSTLLHISRKSLTFDPHCPNFVLLPLLMSEVA